MGNTLSDHSGCCQTVWYLGTQFKVDLCPKESIWWLPIGTYHIIFRLCGLSSGFKLTSSCGLTIMSKCPALFKSKYISQRRLKLQLQSLNTKMLHKYCICYLKISTERSCHHPSLQDFEIHSVIWPIWTYRSWNVVYHLFIELEASFNSGILNISVRKVTIFEKVCCVTMSGPIRIQLDLLESQNQTLHLAASTFNLLRIAND